MNKKTHVPRHTVAKIPEHQRQVEKLKSSWGGRTRQGGAGRGMIIYKEKKIRVTADFGTPIIETNRKIILNQKL